MRDGFLGGLGWRRGRGRGRGCFVSDRGLFLEEIAEGGVEVAERVVVGVVVRLDVVIAEPSREPAH